ncbi:MAG: folate-binding protein YgfZ [Acidobacteriaceae bacterium]|nr:folate-binding protein YgfZ [Acidobacteriaceae bacterium]MBV9781528.1 folate-binding protein YgfZ [Acidobacteriaceae bacterium]
MTGYEGLRADAAWIDLSARGKIRVSGDDRARLIHAMSTNHVQSLQPGEGLYTFFLTSQGRILGDANIYNLGDTLFLDTEPETAAKLRDHLDKYIIADDATLEDETEKWAAIGVEGPESLEAAVKLEIVLPERKYSVIEWRGGFVSRAASTGPEGVRIFVSQNEKSALVEQLLELGIPSANAAEARIVRLENGIPRYGEDISERYLVQETGVMHAVHLNKGCYLGQEIVERVRSRAQIHRVLMPVRIQGDISPVPGTKFSVDGKDVAELTSAAFSPAFGEVVGLAYVRTEATREKPRMIVKDSDPAVSAQIV